jgi:hypothetical protein
MTLDGHALSIGISRYRHVGALPEVQDAQDVAAALADPALCAYPAANVGSLVDEGATRAAILGALDELARRTGPSSTVLIYFSGHGGRARGSEACYLVPVDCEGGTEAQLADTAISGAELSAKLRAIPAARLTVVLDCCRAAGLAEPKDVMTDGLVRELPPAALSLLASGKGRAVFAASGSDGFAYVKPGARNGVFTQHLLEGLRGGAGGAGGVIRVCDLFHYVQQKIAAAGAEQRPVFKADIEENYPVALFRGGRAPVIGQTELDDGFRYDAFISYRGDSSGDRTWALGVLVPALERQGLRLCLERRDFRLGAPRIREMERAVEESRYSVAVFTPDYLDGAFEDFQALMARHNAIESKAPRFIPVIRRPCELHLGLRMTEALDLSDDTEVEAGLERLALALREPPRSRLDG